MTPDDILNDSDVTARFDALTRAVEELREGQDELLRMYEELQRLYPHDCICAQRRREQDRREFLDEDVFRHSTDYEEYRPS
jgi:hypothetical protein